ncbi:hypothetical protein LIER_28009 [Lithospermum erythrorhizon]|uniref:Uncharacterized protein n=1 Tax=Lithospermum erythrorhizon TaxID=34254 RepID=A0AAV3RG48_LITER
MNNHQPLAAPALVAPVASTQAFSKEQMEFLCKMFNQSTMNSTEQGNATCSMAHSGNISQPLTSWIIDFGASDHMTDDSSTFSYEPNSNSCGVRLANGGNYN